MRAETIAVRILGRRSQSLLTPKVSGLPRKARCGRSREWPSWSELEGARGDHQHDVIPGEPPESLKVWARCSYGLAQLQAHTTAGGGPQPLSRPPPADMPPADMPPVYSEALTQEPSQPQQDDAASPASVRHTVFEQQVEDAEECIQKLRNMRKNAFRNYARMPSEITQRVRVLITKNQRLRADSEHRRV